MSFISNKNKNFGAVVTVSTENALSIGVEVSTFYIRKDGKYSKMKKILFEPGQDGYSS